MLQAEQQKLNNTAAKDALLEEADSDLSSEDSEDTHKGNQKQDTDPVGRSNVQQKEVGAGPSQRVRGEHRHAEGPAHVLPTSPPSGRARRASSVQQSAPPHLHSFRRKRSVVYKKRRSSRLVRYQQVRVTDGIKFRSVHVIHI